MTQSRRLQAQALMVVLLGLLGLLTTPSGAVAAIGGAVECNQAQYNCWDSCSRAMFEAQCQPPALPTCDWQPWECPTACQFKSACDEI